MGLVQKIDVDLDEEQATEVQEAIARGEFKTLDEIVSHALEAWWQQRQIYPEDVARLRRLWEEGLASGPPLPGNFDLDDIKRRSAARRASHGAS